MGLESMHGRGKSSASVPGQTGNSLEVQFICSLRLAARVLGGLSRGEWLIVDRGAAKKSKGKVSTNTVWADWLFAMVGERRVEFEGVFNQVMSCCEGRQTIFDDKA